MVARVREDLLTAGTATLAYVEKSVAVVASPFEKTAKPPKRTE
jgi:hypothetical protein